jgi:hypothetical protein
MREALTARYGVVRPFLELLAEALPLGAAPAGDKLLSEVRRLPELARRRSRPGTSAGTRSGLHWCLPPGSGRSTGIRTFLRPPLTGTPTCCASWSSCTGRCAAATSSPTRRCGGPTRAPSCSRRRVAWRPRRSPHRARADRDSRPVPERARAGAGRRLAAARRPDGRRRAGRAGAPGAPRTTGGSGWSSTGWRRSASRSR